jgi:hypothetical protein
MRAVAAALMLLLLAWPAHAQQASTSKPKLQNDGPMKGPPKPKVDEKQYGTAIESLPDKKYDPWKGMR